MGKSSSSSKKLKRSKEDPSSKLRSVKKKKTKTKRSKSKKIRRIKDSSDESESDSSFYSSSSEDEYRREKRRSKLSKKKKRSRKRYSSSSESDDDDDDDVRLLKKKKRSKKKDQHVGTKKKKNKRRRRDSSSSFTSSESDGKKMTREKGRLGKVKDESEEDSEPDESWQVEDDVFTEKNNSRRLKSIVVVPYNYDNDEREEDMVDDESDENMIVDDQRDGAHDNRRSGYDEFEEHHSSETSKASHPDNSLKDGDLEAILKKRALENLKRFRGETQKNETVIKEVPSVSGGETLQPESENIKESQDRPLIEQNPCVSAGDKDLETLQVVNVKESGTGLADSVSQQSQQSGDTARVKAGSGISCCTTKRKLIRPVLGQESLNLASRKEVAGCEDAEAENINGKSCPENSLALATKNGGENMESRKGSTMSSSHNETLDENKGESQFEQKTNDETKSDSQYEQKTMTVMRGGELVQVSYKVYIPKKTSSLGRRQLRR